MRRNPTIRSWVLANKTSSLKPIGSFLFETILLPRIDRFSVLINFTHNFQET